ncbi:imelysin family protein [Rhodoferax koreensis]|uniref:imelysin family protein n=1 Tax=Rhodoferax koreensis TaxID=1842727 RepID=UPI0012FFB579|nr:imelysin family protein [Rhodoferax koreense]
MAWPFVYPADFVRNALQAHFLPAAEAFAASSAALSDQLAPGCAPLPAARERWRAALLAWERLAAVAVGPLIERRSARTVDFWPTRAAMVDAAVAAAPADLTALERIGAPAKGLPAIEYLLWQTQPDAAQCSYAALLAQECAAEAKAILAAFHDMARREWTTDTALPVLQDWIGQAVGGLEQLRWKRIGKPARGGRKTDWPRFASGTTRASWQATWNGLEDFVRGPENNEAFTGVTGLLRGRGDIDIGDELEASAERTHASVFAADPAKPASISSAQKAVAQTKSVLEDKAAAAMQIMVGFSDADGD